MMHASPSAPLAILTVLHASMFAALASQTAPHPPLIIPLFAMGPFLSVVVALGIAGLVSGQKWCAPLVALLSLISFGPQKYVDVAFPLIWPAVLTAQICIVAVLAQTARAPRDLLP